MNFRIKYYLLLVLFVLILIVIYQTTIRKTLYLYTSISYPIDSTKIKQIQFEKASLLKQLSSNDIKCNSWNASYDKYRLSLIKTINDLSEKGTEIVEIPNIESFHVQNYVVSIDSITLKGEYHSLLNILRDIELNNTNSTILGATFERVKNLALNNYILNMKIFILYIKSEK